MAQDVSSHQVHYPGIGQGSSHYEKAQNHDDSSTAKARERLIGSDEVEGCNRKENAKSNHICRNPVPGEEKDGSSNTARHWAISGVISMKSIPIENVQAQR